MRLRGVNSAFLCFTNSKRMTCLQKWCFRKWDIIKIKNNQKLWNSVFQNRSTAHGKDYGLICMNSNWQIFTKAAEFISFISIRLMKLLPNLKKLRLLNVKLTIGRKKGTKPSSLIIEQSPYQEIPSTEK